MGVMSGSFTGTGTSSNFQPKTAGTSGDVSFNLFLTGTGVASITLERSADGGTTWAGIYPAGIQLYTYSYAGTNLSDTGSESEAAVVYRFNCTSFTSGTINYRVGA